MTPPQSLDPITIEILHNGLKSIADEMFIALMKSAYSTNIKERRDHSTSVTDRQGRLICQAEFSLPIHLGSMLGLIEAVLAKHPPETIREGDIFAANDPFVAGGTHLPDINMAIPVFVGGELLGFACNIAHHADMGGMAPGSMAGGMSEIYQEGLRVPVVKLFRQGDLQEDILDILLLNVRVPDERRGDYFAQVASCRLGQRRLKELGDKHGTATLTAAFDEIIRRTEGRLREALRQVPAGTYAFADVMDDDGLGHTDLPIRVRIEVADGRLLLDFAGSSPQVEGNVNCTMSATRAAACYTIKALFDPDIPNNHGVIEVVEIRAERGSIVDAVFPAAVASRAHTCQRIIDAIIGAFAPALPTKVVAAANGANTTAVFSGQDPRTGRGYVYLETLGGGFGGRPTKDGRDGVQVHITNTSNLPIEAIEMEYPLFVASYGFIPDSGGAGRFRGGLGLRRVIEPLGHEAVFSGTGERFRHAPWGLFGGSPGSPGRFVRIEADGTEVVLNGKAADVRFGPGQSIAVETPGAGGFGPPGDRSPDLLERDRSSGKFTGGYVQTHYPGLLGQPEDPATAAAPTPAEPL